MCGQRIEGLGDGVYTHSVIIHEHNFVHPQHPEIHTQNIENLRMREKRKLRQQFGASDALFESYLESTMGVHGLWQLLQPAGRPVSLESLEGKVLAVDVSIWLHQTMKGMRDKDGNPLPNAHLQGLFSRVCKLLFYSIKPVFVFDGGVPILKKQTMAVRKERKAEAERESNDIAQKLLRNLVQSNAVKQALSGTSKPPRRVPGVVGRNQEKDIFELAPLQESEKIGLTLNAEEWERDFELQEKWIRDGMATLADAHPDSEEFRSLPMEIQHEILHEIKERNKYHSLTKLTQMPEDSDSFSSYQLKKLMKQSKLSSRIEEVRKEMSSKSAADLTYSMGDDYYGDEVESRRIMSEDAAHYVLIKGLSKRKQEEEADKYELQNRVKLEKVDEDDKFGVSDYKSEKSSPLLYEEPELMSTSSDSDSGIETFVAKRKSKLSSKKPKNKQVILRHKKRQPKNPVPLYRPPSSDSHKNNSLPQNDSVSKDEFIEVTINPNAARVEDELFPSNIFHTTDQAEVTEQEESDLLDKKKEYTNATEVLGIDRQVTLPSVNLTNGNKSDVVSREVTGVSDEIIAKRKSILDDIRIQLEKKKRENLSTAVDEADSDAVALVSDTCIDTAAVGLDYSVHNTCMDTSTVDLDYSTNGGFFHEESSEDNTSDSQIEGIEADDGGLDTNTFCTPSVSRTPLSSSTELSVPMCDKSEIPQSKSQSSDAENDLQLAIELSLQTAQQENEKNKVCDIVESFNHSTVSSLSKKESNEYIVGKNTDQSCFTNPVIHGSPKKSLSESISPTKSVSRPQPEDLDTDDPCETFHTFNEETLFNFNSYLDSERQALMSEQGKQNRLATSVTDQINHEAQELLRLFGIPYVVSPMEAEAQCAFLDITNQTEGTITDDSDIWLFGGRRMYKNFFNQSKYVEMYSMDNIHNHFGLSRDQLINIALLCGSDYTEGIQGVGPVRALEIMAEFPGDGLEGLKMFSKWWGKAKKKASSESKLRNRLKDLKLNSGFPSEAVVWAYLNPKVDESKERFTWRLPEVDLLREFAKIKFGWPKEKTDQSLLPMMKQLTQKQHQRRISSYFQPENFIKKSKIKSQRLKKALDLVKNPKAANVGSCEEDSSEDNGVHIKKTKQVNEETRKKLSKSDESEQNLAVPTKKKLNKSEKVIKIKKKPNNTEDKKTHDLCFETSQTSSVESRDVGETTDNFMLRMTKKVENAKTELSRKQKTEKVKNRTKQDPKTGSVVSKMLVSLDQVRPHRTCGQKMSKKDIGLKSGVMNLSESSSGESDDQLNPVVSETDEMYNTIGNLKPKSFTKIVEGSQNKHCERFQSIQKSKDLQPDQQLLFKSSKETDHKTTRKISNTEDLSQGETKAVSSMPAALAASMIKVDDPENYCRADVSIINKQNLPETLAYLNQRSKQDSLILHQLKGGQSMNAVERRLEADEKKTKVNKYSSSSDDTLTFDDLLGKMDAAVTENQRSSKKRYMCLAKNAHAVQSKSKRIENKIEMAKVSEKMEVSVPKKVGFGSSDESFDDMNRSHNLNVASPSENSFKTKRARQFDQPIGKADDNFSSTKKSDKKNKFRQQMKHLNDSRSIRGHGILPYSGKNEFIRSNAFSGKGKGRGKNRVEVSLSKDEKDHDGDVQGLNEYETLTEADLGSDFSECDF